MSHLVLLWWQEFATRSVAVFFLDMPPHIGRVKARVVNWKQVDVAAWRSDHQIVPAVLECANCSRYAMAMVGRH